jgi:hypothetical protein
VEIPNNKHQITNKSQHAAQAPALRVTEIQNNKLWNFLEICLPAVFLVGVLVVWNFIGICLPAVFLAGCL